MVQIDNSVVFQEISIFSLATHLNYFIFTITVDYSLKISTLIICKFFLQIKINLKILTIVTSQKILKGYGISSGALHWKLIPPWLSISNELEVILQKFFKIVFDLLSLRIVWQIKNHKSIYSMIQGYIIFPASASNH